MSDGPSAGSTSALVLDTTVLSNYARTNSVEWLAESVAIPVTVHAVRQELEQGMAEGHDYLKDALELLDPVDGAPSDPRDSISVVPLGGLPRNDAPEAMDTSQPTT